MKSLLVYCSGLPAPRPKAHNIERAALRGSFEPILLLAMNGKTLDGVAFN